MLCLKFLSDFAEDNFLPMGRLWQCIRNIRTAKSS